MSFEMALVVIVGTIVAPLAMVLLAMREMKS